MKTDFKTIVWFLGLLTFVVVGVPWMFALGCYMISMAFKFFYGY